MAMTNGVDQQTVKWEEIDLPSAAIGTGGSGGGNGLYNSTPSTGEAVAIPAHGVPDTVAPVGFTIAKTVTIQVSANGAARVAFSADGANFGDAINLMFAGIYKFPLLTQKVHIDATVAAPGGTYVIEFEA